MGSNVGPFSPDKLRSYAQIQADATATAFFSSPSSISLQFKLAKIQFLWNNGVLTNPKSLTHDQFGDFLFDKLKINHEDCLELDLSGRWDTKELVHKTGTKVEHLMTNSHPRNYLNHKITITSLNRPSGPIQSISRDVRVSVCVSVCMFVRPLSWGTV